MTRPQLSTRPGPTPLRVRQPGDFVALVPYLVGFHPTESVVAVFSQQGRVLLTARIDLPPPRSADVVAGQLDELCGHHEADELVLVAYGEDTERTRQVLEQVAGLVVVPVRVALWVSGGRWWSLHCDEGCCPPEGTPYDPAAHRLAAEAVYAGLSVAADRSVLERQVRGPDTADLPRLAAALTVVEQETASLDRSQAARLIVDTLRRCRDDPAGPEEADCLLLAVLTADRVIRDVAWALMVRARIADDVRIWSAVVARTPEELASGPLGLLGAAAWISGNGALQNCCTERLELIDPGYTLGHLLADISERALPPRAWDEMAEDMREEVRAVAGLEGLY